MPAALLGRKIGMTRVYDGAGNNVPVTVIQAGPCFVSQVKTTERRDNGKRDGYNALQVAFEDVKPRNSTQPVIAHDHAAGLGPKRCHHEFRLKDAEVGQFELGQQLTVEVFDNVRFVDVSGTSKGKGTAGVMKRWHFKGMPASHGCERKHRSPGSICSRASNRGTGKPKRGVRMGGRMGAERVTVRSLEIVGRDKDKNLLLVKGPVPGPNRGLLEIREAKRLYKRKATLSAEAK
jgi:large subunit ribosomal protein L3